MKISVVIIAKNAQDQIKECLSSVSFANEVLVVDSGSTDNTIEIAKGMGAKILGCKTADFSEMRNIGLEKAAGEWVLYIDTDEVISPELEADIKLKISSNEPNIAAYKVKRKNFYLGKHEWPKIEKLERLFKRNFLKGWYGSLHESPIIKGEIGELEGFLLHYTHRNLTLMLAKTIEWSKVEAQLRFKANHPKMSWWRFPRVMFTAFFDSYVKQGGWKVGTAGLVESIYQSFSMFVTYARLWEMQAKKDKKL
ncbi:glycosyltransferase family 2 protein [Candidatus Microgenomates bacterium]|nr:MAG: glycosyltransferase family 2 protein [Candidatus Microgenomates bacterium]